MLKKKYRFIVIIILLEFLILINFNTNIRNPTIINPKISNPNTDFQNPTIVENIGAGMLFYQLSMVKNQNDNYAWCNILPITNTKWIRCTDFDFSLPDNSIIEGIEVQIDDFDGFFNEVLAQDIYLVLNGVKIGIDKESGNPIGTSDTDTYRIYGSSIDMWSTELTKVDIESSTFGVQIFYYNPNTFISFMVNVDNIQIKVFYYISDDDNEAPTWDNLIESSDPLELGNTEIINIDVYDDSVISFVYIDINNINYTIDFISNDNYRYSTWTPITIGVKNYSIWLIDEFNNINWTGIYNITVIDLPLEPICKTESIILMSFMLGVISILLFLIILMLFLYKKINKFLPTLILFLFSLIIGISSITIITLPFIPYFSLFFILFQTSIFIIKSLKIYNK